MKQDFSAPEFQLTRSRGARHAAWQCLIDFDINFNSRAHVERDQVTIILRKQKRYFNSRAHVERDYISTIFRGYLKNFNSRAHVERDNKINPILLENGRFQLTRSRGARPSQGILPCEVINFNSRAHVERDAKKPKKYSPETNFNSRAHVERDPQSCGH